MMYINTGIKLLVLLCFQKVHGQLISHKAQDLGANPLKLIEKFYRRCFADKKTVLFISANTSYINVPDFVNSNAIIILNADFKHLKKRIVPNIAFIQKVDIYIFDVDITIPVPSLVNVIKKDVHGWNMNAHFFVIISNYRCDYLMGLVFNALKPVLYKNDISIYVICNNFIHTFNPYNFWLPAIWTPSMISGILVIVPGVFCTDFTKDENKCPDILYNHSEKKQKPAEINLVMEISKDDECNLVTSSKRSVMLNYTIRIISLLSKIMKIPFEEYLKCVHEKSYIDASGKGIGPAIEGVANGEYSLLLNPKPMRDTRNTLVSAITGKMYIAIIMHHRKPLSIFQRIVQYFGIGGFITCLIFGVISTIVLKCCLKTSLMWSAIQSMALLLIGTSNIGSKRNSLRIFIVVLSLFGFILGTTFSNQVLSIMYGTGYDDVKTVKEFKAIASQYKLFCPPGMDIYVNEYLNQLCYPVVNHGCEIILNDPGAACFYYKRSSYEMVTKNNLHIVPEMLAYAYMSYKMKSDWRLDEQFNRACTRLFQSHIPPVLINRYIYRFHRQLEISENQNQEGHNALKLEDVMFAFQVLYIGLALAFLSFLYEIKLWSIIADLIRKLWHYICFRYI